MQFGAQWLGINTSVLIEVVPDREVRKVAHRNALKLEGLANVRGQLHLVVNVRAHFGFGDVQAPLEKARMVLMKTASSTLAFRADALDCVHSIERSDIQAAPVSLAKSLSQCVLGSIAMPGRDVLVVVGHAFGAELEGAWYS